MPKVLAHTILCPGHVYPFLAVLTELQGRGFAVTLCVNTPAESAPEQIESVPVRGIRWHPPVRVPTNQGRRAAERVWLDNVARTGEPLANALDQLVAEERPDFLLIDPTLWGAMVAAEAGGLPWASLSHNPLSIRGRGLDVRGPGLGPPRSPIEHCWHRVVDFGLRVSFVRSLDMVNSLRAKRGLGTLADFRDRYLTAPLIIAATAEPFEYPRADWPHSLVFVGPLVWEPLAKRPDWLDELDERPVLLLVGSTVEDRTAGAWIGKVFEALADESVQVVATLPTDEVPQPVPSNFFVTPFVPHRYILPRVQCVICHGGYGITAKALMAGVPVVAIPLRALDRVEVARRVEVAGAGVMVVERGLTAERLKAAVRTAIACKAGAERIAEAFRGAGGAGAAADAIESLLASHKKYAPLLVPTNRMPVQTAR